jgi:pimeloyl-ACP methyl ester carboxylesterase
MSAVTLLKVTKFVVMMNTSKIVNKRRLMMNHRRLEFGKQNKRVKGLTSVAVVVTIFLTFMFTFAQSEATEGELPMNTVTSKDRSRISFRQTGQGPVVVLVDGAVQYSAFDQSQGQLVKLLAEYFTVIQYDRRGRGESTDTQPYAVAREIEDIEALIDEAGGTAFVYGISSGAALAMEAAIALPDKIEKLAMYEPPYNDDATAQQSWKNYTKELGGLLAANRRGDAVALFMMLVGAPAEAVEGMRQDPVWPLFEAIAPTLAYDHIFILGETAALPTERAAQVTVPTLVMDGGASFPFMHTTALALAKTIPNANHHTLEGQTHEVSAEALAPVLIEFFKR